MGIPSIRPRRKEALEKQKVVKSSAMSTHESRKKRVIKEEENTDKDELVVGRLNKRRGHSSSSHSEFVPQVQLVRDDSFPQSTTSEDEESHSVAERRRIKRIHYDAKWDTPESSDDAALARAEI